jgi:hypothetical protein
MYERDVPNVAGNVADPPPTELRFEHAYDLAAYDLGARHAQFAAADNLTYHF